MSQDFWHEVQTIYAAALEAPSARRTELLRARCADNAEMRAEVESLLASHDRMTGFLDDEGKSSDDAPSVVAIAVGQTIGGFRLTERIGEGGMGTVYRAERADGEFTQRIALKLISAPVVTIDTLRRFRSERQILAALNHPHIVTLLDGGVSDNGQAYLAMEFVDGVPITRYVAERRVSLEARVRLVQQVGGAVQHAHQHSVVHRDLKPANILVTSDGVPKVLDFGVAKLIADQPGTMVDATLTGAFHPMTPNYASPEQLRGLPATTASDIYALGVLLYEVLSGTRPYQTEGKPLDAVLDVVLQGTPRRPSAAAASASPALPYDSRRLRGDLDAIVLRALAPTPTDRYASVSELTADLDRFLAGQPVLAVPPRATYLVGRFIKRNKVVTAIAATLLLSLAAGAIVYARQAEIERRRFEDARRLVHTVIFEIQPKLEGIPATLPLRQTLIEGTMQYLEAMSRDAGNNVGLLHELSNAYQQLARVQGDLTVSTMGQQAPAVGRFARADALMQRALAIAPSDPALLKDAALLYGRLAGFDNTQGKPAEAVRHARMSVDYAERNVAARVAGEFDAREILAGSTFYLAVADDSNWEFRVATFKRSAELFRQLATEQPTKEALTRNLASIARYLSSLHADRGQSAAAIEYAGQSLAASEKVLAGRPSDIGLQLDAAVGFQMLASAIDTAAGNAAEAAAYFQRAIAQDEAILATDASNARATLLLADATRLFARNRLRAGDVNAARGQITRSLETFATLERNGQLPAGLNWRLASATGILADVDRVEVGGAAGCAHYQRATSLFNDADRQSPLVDALKTEADRVRQLAAACPK